MCGIAGLVGPLDRTGSSEAIGRMIDAQKHRGPDASGEFLDDGIALGHTRLKIIDLSEAGAQPFVSPDGRYTMVFNGEIYNYKSIASELGDVQYKSDSDTEVLLHAFIKWGKDCLHRLNGMFALAIWDRETQELFIARDRLGIKPLYYFIEDDKLVFASEIRSLLASQLVPRKIDRSALVEYLTYHTVHAPRTLIKGINMLLPGYAGVYNGKDLHVAPYWDLLENRDQCGYTKRTAQTRVRQLLLESVERRLVSDVPIGAFLSGGIDSSALVGLMSEVSTDPIHTFSIAFDEEAYSEKKYADIVAKKFKTEHTSINLASSELLDSLPEILGSMDHPSVDGPNTYMVSKATKEAGITVAISGLGGDELFAGYPVFTQLPKLLRSRIMRSPQALREMVAWLGSGVLRSSKGKKALRLLKGERSLSALYPEFRKVDAQDEISKILNDKIEQEHFAFDFLTPDALLNENELLAAISHAEIRAYMQNVLLRDADQMSMAHALEIRVPFLDHKLVELAMGLGDDFKEPIFPKSSLVESLQGLLPDEIVHRKKMGFTFPWSTWVRQDLKELCDKNIRSLAEQIPFSGKELNGFWHGFLSGETACSWTQVWSLVVLNTWIEDNDIHF